MRPSSLINLDTDKCACKCFNPNGILILIAVQVLVFIAACFSTVAMVDCHFVSVDAAKVDPALAQIFKDTFGEPAMVPWTSTTTSEDSASSSTKAWTETARGNISKISMTDSIPVI
jgi:hypothetical protein